MRLGELRTARDRAALPILDRIEADRRAAPARLAPLLAAIHSQLFEPDLRYETLRQELGIRDHARVTEFKRYTGVPPALYVRLRRLEAAETLLAETDIPIADVGALVGYETAASFSAVFARQYGMPPRVYRRTRHRRPAAEPEGEIADRPTAPAMWRRLIGERLETADALELVRIVLDQHPDAAPRVTELALDAASARWRGASASDPADLEQAERLLARVLWSSLSRQPVERQKELIRSQGWLLRPALFWLLGDAYLAASRRDPAEGIQVASLAVEVATALRLCSDEDGTCELQALGWAWLANAKRLSLDLPGAAAAFRASRARLPDAPSPRVAGEIDLQEACLFSQESRYAEAASLAADAGRRLRELETPHLYIRSLNLAGSIEVHRGSARNAIRPLREACRLAELAGDRDLQVMSHGNLLAALLEAEDARALRALTTLRSLLASTSVSSPAVAARLLWLEGVVAMHRGEIVPALELFGSARAALVAAGKLDQVAYLDLDVAQAELARGNAPAAMAAALAASRVLDDARSTGRLEAALTAAGGASEAVSLDAETLRRIRRSLGVQRWPGLPVIAETRRLA